MYTNGWPNPDIPWGANGFGGMFQGYPYIPTDPSDWPEDWRITMPWVLGFPGVIPPFPGGGGYTPPPAPPEPPPPPPPPPPEPPKPPEPPTTSDETGKELHPPGTERPNTGTISTDDLGLDPEHGTWLANNWPIIAATAGMMGVVLPNIIAGSGEPTTPPSGGNNPPPPPPVTPPPPPPGGKELHPPGTPRPENPTNPNDVDPNLNDPKVIYTPPGGVPIPMGPDGTPTIVIDASGTSPTNPQGPGDFKYPPWVPPGTYIMSDPPFIPPQNPLPGENPFPPPPTPPPPDTPPGGDTPGGKKFPWQDLISAAALLGPHGGQGGMGGLGGGYPHISGGQQGPSLFPLPIPQGGPQAPPSLAQVFAMRRNG